MLVAVQALEAVTCLFVPITKACWTNKHLTQKGFVRNGGRLFILSPDYPSPSDTAPVYVYLRVGEATKKTVKAPPPDPQWNYDCVL